jgi:hypothetical protein
MQVVVRQRLSAQPDLRATIVEPSPPQVTGNALVIAVQTAVQSSGASAGTLYLQLLQANGTRR